jgi:hypothetical protein
MKRRHPGKSTGAITARLSGKAPVETYTSGHAYRFAIECLYSETTAVPEQRHRKETMIARRF